MRCFISPCWWERRRPRTCSDSSSMNSLGFPNPPLGYAFAAPFAKGGRQTRSDWQGDFDLILLQGYADRPLIRADPPRLPNVRATTLSGPLAYRCMALLYRMM